jgi:cytochrome c-type biogenesis protein CcmE
MKSQRRKAIGFALLIVILMVAVLVRRMHLIGNQDARVLSVDELVAQPEHYRGMIHVTGMVIKADPARAMFTMGCEDACMSMPVKFRGELPAEKEMVMAYGQVRMVDRNQYVFEASEVVHK